MDSDKQMLMDYFGVSEYHDYQLSLIQHIINKKSDVICRYRTGSGKSLTYLMPAILHNYTILVISPLCSLITDQVSQINANVLKKKIAFNLSSSKSVDEENIDEKEVFDTNGSEDSAPRILFCTPEKLGTEIFRAKLMKKHKQTPFAYFVLDECHLIVESGNSFRADYMKVDWLRNELKGVPILCYSATCNHFVTDQIKSLLHMTNPTVFQNDNSKKNLFLSIHSVSKHNQTCKCGSKNCSWHSKSDITSDSIIKAVDYYQAGEVLVLCNSRSDVEKLNQHLQKILPSKIVEFYHAGLSDDTRSEIQQKFVNGEIDILVATNASFGVGINLPLVLKVVVVGTPMSIQTISQAIGRGGRKGQQYYVDFFIKEADIIKNRIMLEKESPGMVSTYRKYTFDSFDAVQYLVANSAADKSKCLLNIILQGVDAVSTLLAVPYSDLQDFKKKNSTMRPCNRAKWNRAEKKWYLPPFAQNTAVAHWNKTKHAVDVLLDTADCGKCSNCRTRENQ
jgi:ATP-dependent DNA helicase RecQ